MSELNEFCEVILDLEDDEEANSVMRYLFYHMNDCLMPKLKVRGDHIYTLSLPM
jgi:hypothetical protein